LPESICVADRALRNRLGNVRCAAEGCVSIAGCDDSTPNQRLGECERDRPNDRAACFARGEARLIRNHVKYVFVLFQKNRSFDFYFGSYPGADGLYAGPRGAYTAEQAAGFTQTIVNTDGTLGTITPFRIPARVTDATGKTVPIYPADIASVNHTHVGIARKLALDASGVA
jgi:phospholipase C